MAIGVVIRGEANGRWRRGPHVCGRLAHRGAHIDGNRCLRQTESPGLMSAADLVTPSRRDPRAIRGPLERHSSGRVANP